MKKEEINYLISQKEKEGKSPKQIVRDLKGLYDSKITFKNNEKEIKKLQEKCEKLKKENDDLRKKLMNAELNTSKQEDIMKQLNNKSSEMTEKLLQKKGFEDTLKQIKKYNRRIVNALKTEDKPLGVKELSEICCSTTSSIYPSLNLLEDFNVIKAIPENQTKKFLI
ncbi:MAG: hypothetical protein ACOC56_05415 [Atribacterota bacterium]